jgi:hypothetical protein
MRSRSWLLVLLAVAAAAACGDSSSPTTTAVATTTTSSAGPTTTVARMTVSAYLVRDEKVALVHRSVPQAPTTLDASLRELLRGPTPEEAGIGLGTAIPSGTTLRSATITNGVATVDLSRSFESGGGSLSMTERVAQVVYTATQFSTVQRVAFRLDGTDVTTIGGEGVIVSPPLGRADLEDRTPRVFIDDPAPFDAVAATFTTKGTSNVFEAVHQIQVLGPSGTVIWKDFVMASSGTGTRGTWSKTITLPAGTTGPITLRMFEPSAEDGRPLGQVDIPLTVR